MDVAVEGFLLGPPPKVTQAVKLSVHLVFWLTEAEEEAREPHFVDLKEDYEVLYWPDPIEDTAISS